MNCTGVLCPIQVTLEKSFVGLPITYKHGSAGSNNYKKMKRANEKFKSRNDELEKERLGSRPSRKKRKIDLIPLDKEVTHNSSSSSYRSKRTYEEFIEDEDEMVKLIDNVDDLDLSDDEDEE